MTNRNLISITAFALVLVAVPLCAQDAKPKIDVLEGPGTAKLGGIAQIEVPVGYEFFDGKMTRVLLKSWGEPTSGREVGFLHPTNAHWSVYFDFDDRGYVKDDDKDKLDPDKLLKEIKADNDVGNEERKRTGNPPLIIVGWEQQPKYNPETHNLEWAIRMTSEGKPLLNYNTRLLGRKGVMEVILVCKPEDLHATLTPFKGLLTNYKFSSGESYAEYRPGDKVAKYGLAALITTGAAVGAAKLGLLGWVLPLLKKIWYLVVVAVVAVANFFKRIFAKLTGKKDEVRLEE